MNTIPYGEDELARPLSDAELDELEAFFASEACRECGLTLSAVDGFLAALASSPINLQPEQWQPQLWGDSLPFQAADQERRITRLLQRQLNDISWRLREEPDSWEPVLYQHGVPGREMLDGAEWSWGYLLCVDSWREDWEPLFEDPVGEALEPMYLLGTEELEDEDKALVKTAVQRHTYAKKLRESALAIHRWGAPRRPPLVETVRRETAKVGRNDPCPCGSGKKYKKCCGAEGQPA